MPEIGSVETAVETDAGWVVFIAPYGVDAGEPWYEDEYGPFRTLDEVIVFLASFY